VWFAFVFGCVGELDPVEDCGALFTVALRKLAAPRSTQIVIDLRLRLDHDLGPSDDEMIGSAIVWGLVLVAWACAFLQAHSEHDRRVLWGFLPVLIAMIVSFYVAVWLGVID
jgi:hypothetical protein